MSALTESAIQTQVSSSSPDDEEAAQTFVEQAAADGVVFPPGDLESDEPPLESSLHLYQIFLLLSCLNWLWKDRNDYFAAGNLTIYYNAQRLKNKDFRGPDFFVVLGAEKRPRRSWTLWEEGGKYPHVIVELLSNSTAKVDRSTKKDLYQNTFRIPDYFWFDPHSLEFEGWHLVDGVYQPLPLNENGWRWSQQLGLYLGVYEEQLRFFTPAGELVPTLEEAVEAASQRAEAEQQRAEAEQQRAEAEQQRAEAERQRAEAERQRAEAEQQRAEAQQQRAEAERQRNERLLAKLQELGVDPEEIL